MKLVATLVVALCASLTFVNGDDGDGPTPTPGPATTSTPKPTEKTTECKAPAAIQGGKDIPTLDKIDEFQTTVEAKFLKSPRNGFKPFVLQVREYVSDKKRAVFQANGTTEKHMLFDLTEGHAFAFNVGEQCVGKQISKYEDIADKELYFQFSIGTNNKTGTMMGLEDIYAFSTTYKPSQTSASEIVRGINCEKWSTCITWNKYDDNDFLVDFYWSKSDVKMPLNDDPVPVRVVVKGYAHGKSDDEGSLRYHHIYDFIGFQKKVSDKSILWPELKELCGDHTYYQLNKNKDHAFPGISDTFSVDLEQTSDKGDVNPGKYVMDHVNNLMRTDLHIDDGDISFYKEKCGLGSCKVIHDFNVGLEFAIKEDGSCGVYAIPVQGNKDGKLPLDIIVHTGDKPDDKSVTMAAGMHLFKVGKENGTDIQMEYQGKRLFREVEVDAWVARYSSDKVYQEVLLREGKMWGIIHKEKDGKGKWASFRINFFNYNENPDMSAFDIHYCFSDKKEMTKSQKENFISIHGRLTLKEKWDEIIDMGMTNVQRELRKQLVKSSGVNALRITDMMISKNGKNDDNVRFWFTVLWASPISGTVYHEGTPAAQKPTDDAVDDLEKDLKEDKVVTIAKGKKITIKGGSLKSDEDTMKDDPRPSQQNVIKTGHSGGQMAILGICMLIFGAVIGIGVGFYLWKRRGRGVPYQIHH